MNTPAHLVVNLALLGGGRRRDFGFWIAAGAVLPDVPMFLFYLWQRFAAGESEARIWGELYFQDGWQIFFDGFNSIPLAAVGCLVAWRIGKLGVALCFASVLLHAAMDLPLHHNDGHRHFLPLSDWRFASPVSYWDPAHHGALAAFGEAVAVLASSAVLWRRTPHRLPRAALATVCTLYVAGYIAFYS